MRKLVVVAILAVCSTTFGLVGGVSSVAERPAKATTQLVARRKPKRRATTELVSRRRKPKRRATSLV